MKIVKNQINCIYGNDEIIDKINIIIYSIERIFNNYNELSYKEKYEFLSVFYTFEMDENEELSIEDVINEFDKEHGLIDIYNDIKSYLAILIYNINRNAITENEEEASLALKYYYNTSFKKKNKSLE